MKKTIDPPLRLLLVAGARPNFMKIAPLINSIDKANREREAGRRIDYRLIHTGQHYDVNMSRVFFRELRLPRPHVNLGVGSGSHAVQTAGIMCAFEPVCLREKPDWVVVVGDVNSTLACTIVASKLRFKVAHIEAGLRSFDRSMPEEINRVVTDRLADLLLTPSSDANANLLREGVPRSKIRLVGNIMIDSLVNHAPLAARSRLPRRLGLKRKEFVYVTLHRPANVDDEQTLRSIAGELSRLATRCPVVFPIHPRTRKMLQRYRIDLKSGQGVFLLDPIGYLDSLWLTQNASFILTDSGGLQEESTYFRTPCLTLRPNTERPITIKLGTNKLTSPASLGADIEAILRGHRPDGKIPRYWDGRTADRILEFLRGG